jgi:hypothetical protein
MTCLRTITGDMSHLLKDLAIFTQLVINPIYCWLVC